VARQKSTLRTLLKWCFVILLVIGYPMLLSIYLFLPLMIGIAGYGMIVGLERNRLPEVLVALLYFFNLDINLSLPFLLAPISILFVYKTVYPKLHLMKHCSHCIAFVTVLSIDVVYLGIVKLYDFVMQTTTVALDSILFYSLFVDLIMAVII
jgi:hypothetical protein